MKTWQKHSKLTGHRLFAGRLDRDWQCRECSVYGSEHDIGCPDCRYSLDACVCGTSGKELTLEQVLGKERVEAYQQAYEYVRACEADLSVHLAEGDSIHAHAMGIKL